MLWFYESFFPVVWISFFLLARKHGLALFDPNWTSVYSVQEKSSLVNQSTSRKIRISFGKESVAINPSKSSRFWI